MAKIQTIKDKDGNIVYPQTDASAVFIDANTKLSDKITEIEGNGNNIVTLTNITSEQTLPINNLNFTVGTVLKITAKIFAQDNTPTVYFGIKNYTSGKNNSFQRFQPAENGSQYIWSHSENAQKYAYGQISGNFIGFKHPIISEIFITKVNESTVNIGGHTYNLFLPQDIVFFTMEMYSKGIPEFAFKTSTKTTIDVVKIEKII